MLLAKKGPDSDIHMIVSQDKKTFFCIHTDRTRYRLWEPAIEMDVTGAYHHVKMHIQLGHKVPDGILSLIQLQPMLSD